jgi:DNA-binding response OmpR family regulator
MAEIKRNTRILILDDDENILESVSTALQDAGYLVDAARNARDAVEKSEANFYNLALVDIRLPDIEGTKLLTGMKEMRPETILIILTGYPSLQNAVEALNNGADGYLTKPIEMEELLRVVQTHLKKQKELFLYLLEDENPSP